MSLRIEAPIKASEGTDQTPFNERWSLCEGLSPSRQAEFIYEEIIRARGRSKLTDKSCAFLEIPIDGQNIINIIKESLLPSKIKRPLLSYFHRGQGGSPENGDIKAALFLRRSDSICSREASLQLIIAKTSHEDLRISILSIGTAKAFTTDWTVSVDCNLDYFRLPERIRDVGVFVMARELIRLAHEVTPRRLSR